MVAVRVAVSHKEGAVPKNLLMIALVYCLYFVVEDGEFSTNSHLFTDP